MANANTETVGVGFLIQYLSAFYDLPTSKQLSKEQRKDILKIFEDKVANGAIQLHSPSYIEELSKIVYKDKSTIVRDVLVQKL